MNLDTLVHVGKVHFGKDHFVVKFTVMVTKLA
jgi:hypothetical protein